MTRLTNEATGSDITGDTRMSHVMDLWLADFAEKVARGTRAHKSHIDYRDTINNYLRPRLGELLCREADNAGLVDETLKDIRRAAAKVSKRGKNGQAAALRARTVLSHVCGLALRHEAMRSNPVKSVEPMDHEQDEIRALEPDQRAEYLAKLRQWIEAKTARRGNRLGVRVRAWTDLPDLVEGMLSTGIRIGEVLAIIGSDVDPQHRTVRVGYHLVRIEGVGMRRVANRKGNRPGLTLVVPPWSVSMWRRVKLAAGDGPVWPTWNGGWEDPGNVGKRIAQASDGIGFGWVSSRILRHTVATHLGDADVASTAIADQLGNTAQVVEKHYRRKRVANEQVAGVLDSLLDSSGNL